jgi:hypothetical protein
VNLSADRLERLGHRVHARDGPYTASLRDLLVLAPALQRQTEDAEAQPIQSARGDTVAAPRGCEWPAGRADHPQAAWAVNRRAGSGNDPGPAAIVGLVATGQHHERDRLCGHRCCALQIELGPDQAGQATATDPPQEGATSQADCKIEILHVCDPDSVCDIRLFVNGEEAKGFEPVDVGPGHGYEREA